MKQTKQKKSIQGCRREGICAENWLCKCREMKTESQASLGIARAVSGSLLLKGAERT